MVRFAVIAALCVGSAEGVRARKLYQCAPATSTSPENCVQASPDDDLSTGKFPYTLASCRLNCGLINLPLWPMPVSVEIDETVKRPLIDFSDIVMKIEFNTTAADVSAMLTSAFDEFKEDLNLPKDASGLPVVAVSVGVSSSESELRLSTDESYTMHMDSNKVSINSKTFFGARHALATLKQLITTNTRDNKASIRTGLVIEDKPAYPYRSILLDTGRNFLPVSKIMSTVKAMGENKLNTMHLHLSDTSSFPVEIKSVPNITTFGAFSDDEVYSQDHLKAIVAYATLHGVRVVPEMDQPAHAREGWQWGPAAGLGDLTVCTGPTGQGYNQVGFEYADSHALEPPPGQMNPGNPNLLPVLTNVTRELVDIFGGSVYHLGGDEVMVGDSKSWASCWGTAPSVIKEVLKHDKTNKLLPGWEKMTDAALAAAVNISDPGWNDGFYGVWKRFTVNVSKIVVQEYAKSQSNGQSKLEKMVQWGGQATGAGTTLFNLFSQDDVTEVLPPDQFMIQVWDTVYENALATSPQHVWANSIAPDLMSKGYDLVLSHVDFTYLDCGASGWIKADFSNPWGGYWCPRVQWYSIYDYIPTFLHESAKAVKAGDAPKHDISHIKGAELTAWGETISAGNLDMKLWPRAAALAEGLWTNGTYSSHALKKVYDSSYKTVQNRNSKNNNTSGGPTSYSYWDAWYGAGRGATADRLVFHNDRMQRQGIGVSTMQAHWCLLNPGNCYIKPAAPKPSPPPVQTCPKGITSKPAHCTATSPKNPNKCCSVGVPGISKVAEQNTFCGGPPSGAPYDCQADPSPFPPAGAPTTMPTASI